VRALPTGKLPASLLAELLASAPSLPAEVQLGPAIGEDACAISVDRGVLVAATDPITLTGSGVGSHAVWINANDVAVMGVRPRWFTAVVLLPAGTSEAEVRAMFDTMCRTLEALDVALVGGHTEVTEAVVQPVVVGQMFGWSDGSFVRTGGAMPGDRIVQVGGAPVEAAAVLAAEASNRLGDIDAAVLARAREAIESPGISVVEPALLAAGHGASSLHDPTEGGLAEGLWELAGASGVRIRLDTDAVTWFEPGRIVCEALGASPWGALASGTLLAAFPEASLDGACAALRERGHDANVIGRAELGEGVVAGDGAPLERFPRDEVARVLSGGPRPPPTPAAR
jgi:hydrogenase maturation factor